MSEEPIWDVDALRCRFQMGCAPPLRFFWGHRAHPSGRLTDACFSQWWPCEFVVDGRAYTSAEQFMMASKALLFEDAGAFEAIMATSDPARIKSLGRTVRRFDEARWTAARFDIVTRGSVAKFGQDARLGEHLARTGDDVLVEASPLDRVWGIGLAKDSPEARDPRAWRGLNLLGFALGRARAILAGRASEP